MLPSPPDLPRSSQRLKASILLPFVLANGALILFAASIWYGWRIDNEQRQHDQASFQLQTTFEQAAEIHSDGMLRTLQILAGLDEPIEKFKQGDRAALLEVAKPLFAEISREREITHLYFVDLDRVCFLRVHEPSRFGDVIDRQTMLGAARTGLPARGFELGPLGTLTLRIVIPWEVDGQRLGYLELGTEASHLLTALDPVVAATPALFVRTDLLANRDFRAGQAMLGHDTDTRTWGQWTELTAPDSSRFKTAALLPPSFDPGQHGALTFWADGHSWRAAAFTIRDVGGIDVGRAVALLDITHERQMARRTLMIGGIAMAVVMTMLLALFWRSLGTFEANLMALQADRRRLDNLARVDPLTGTENRRQLDATLPEVEASARASGRPAVVLMLDLDHFKAVNDTFGHDRGDDVLRRVARVLRDNAPQAGQTFRYGGEEFTMVLPASSPGAAEPVANRIRADVEALALSDGRGGTLRCTISIGMAMYDPASARDSMEAALKRADVALYQAKAAGRNRVVATWHKAPGEA